MKKSRKCLLFWAILLSGLLLGTYLVTSYYRIEKEAEARLKRDLDEMEKIVSVPLRKKIGRMLIVGLDSCALKPHDPVIGKIRDYGVGGIILFGYNIPEGDSLATRQEKLARLCADLRGLADYKLLIGIDQEGGKVMRLRLGEGYSGLPSHASLGRMDNESVTRYFAGETAQLLENTGINLNFAPCVDVNVNPSCPVIGKIERSFSGNGAKVAEHAGYFIDEHRRNGVLTAIKHFPGHGSSVSDSHKGLPDISNTWKSDELVPFRILVEEDLCDIVMVGHLFNRQIDSLYPASLSRATVEGLLRNELGWDGLVVSDDLGMKAICSNYSLEQSLELCINAGVDMLMLIANRTPERVIRAIDLIESMVLDGRIPEKRITDAYRRIVKL